MQGCACPQRPSNIQSKSLTLNRHGARFWLSAAVARSAVALVCTTAAATAHSQKTRRGAFFCCPVCCCRGSAGAGWCTPRHQIAGQSRRGRQHAPLEPAGGGRGRCQHTQAPAEAWPAGHAAQGVSRQVLGEWDSPGPLPLHRQFVQTHWLVPRVWIGSDGAPRVWIGSNGLTGNLYGRYMPVHG